MTILRGRVVQGDKHFSSWRLPRDDFRAAYRKATGQDLHRGTLNVLVDRSIPVKEDFRILGTEIGEPDQDLIFENCRVNGIGAYRIRPLNLHTGDGGHGTTYWKLAALWKFPIFPMKSKLSYSGMIMGHDNHIPTVLILAAQQRG
jgi:hypothetical protein